MLFSGGGLRVYLVRPWFSSGEGELLGAVLWKPSGIVISEPQRTQVVIASAYGFMPGQIVKGALAAVAAQAGKPVQFSDLRPLPSGDARGLASFFTVLGTTIASLVFAVLLGFSPKFGALIQTIPTSVMGGVSIVVFGLITVAGARIWVDNKVNFADSRNMLVAAITLVLGTGDFTLKFGGFALGGIGTATFGAILLNAVLSRGRR